MIDSHDNARMAGEPPFWLVALLCLLFTVVVLASVSDWRVRTTERRFAERQMVTHYKSADEIARNAGR